VIWIITALHGALLLLFATVAPTWRSPDEPNHADLVLHVAQNYEYPRFDGLNVDAGVVESMREVYFSRRSRNLLAEEARARDDRPSFDALAQEARPSSSERLNQMTQHPPLYYVTMAAAWRVVRAVVPFDALTSFDRQVWVLRVLSALLVLPLPLFAWMLARRLGLPPNAGIVAALIPLGIPQLTHIGSSVNSDAGVILLGALLLFPVLRLAAGDLAVRHSALAGLFAGLGLLTKGFAFAFVICALLGVAVGARLGGRRAALRAAVIVSGVAFVAGGWWWLRNILVFHKVSPKGRYLPRAEGFTPDWERWTTVFFRAIFRRFWGHFGWYDVALPSAVWVTAAVACGILTILAFARGPRVVAPNDRRQFLGTLLVLFVPGLVLFGFIALQAMSSYRKLGNVAFVQGRYLFAMLIAGTLLVATGVATLGARALRVAPLATLLGVLVMQYAALARMLDFYWGAPDAGVADRVRALVEWSPWAPEFLALLVAFGVLMICVLLAALAKDAFGRRPVSVGVAADR
jgi:small subunit ribosomal protein S36